MRYEIYRFQWIWWRNKNKPKPNPSHWKSSSDGQKSHRKHVRTNRWVNKETKDFNGVRVCARDRTNMLCMKVSIYVLRERAKSKEIGSKEKCFRLETKCYGSFVPYLACYTYIEEWPRTHTFCLYLVFPRDYSDFMYVIVVCSCSAFTIGICLAFCSRRTVIFCHRTKLNLTWMNRATEPSALSKWKMSHENYSLSLSVWVCVVSSVL